jgi:hypothetical protein
MNKQIRGKKVWTVESQGLVALAWSTAKTGLAGPTVRRVVTTHWHGHRWLRWGRAGRSSIDKSWGTRQVRLRGQGLTAMAWQRWDDTEGYDVMTFSGRERLWQCLAAMEEGEGSNPLVKPVRNGKRRLAVVFTREGARRRCSDKIRTRAVRSGAWGHSKGGVGKWRSVRELIGQRNSSWGKGIAKGNDDVL